MEFVFKLAKTSKLDPTSISSAPRVKISLTLFTKITIKTKVAATSYCSKILQNLHLLRVTTPSEMAVATDTKVRKCQRKKSCSYYPRVWETSVAIRETKLEPAVEVPKQL